MANTEIALKNDLLKYKVTKSKEVHTTQMTTTRQRIKVNQQHICTDNHKNKTQLGGGQALEKEGQAATPNCGKHFLPLATFLQIANYCLTERQFKSQELHGL